MGKTISLKGGAAKAFIEGASGLAPKTEEDKYMRVATYIHMEMARKNKDGEAKAKLILKCLAAEGLDWCLSVIEGRRLSG